MNFLEHAEKKYSSLPGVEVNYVHSDCLTIKTSDSEKVITVSVWNYGNTPLYRVSSEENRGVSTESMSEARDYLWISYLDMIGDLA